jgi:CRP/FNR family cyclic AMP-dependent transcriptional regulator
MDETPRSASVITLEKTKLGILSRQSFKEILMGHPEIALKIINQLTGRIRLLSENVRTLGLLDVYGRVAKTLLDLATPHDGVMVIEHRPTHQEIANTIGSSREMVSRIMKDLVFGGYISTEGKQLIINENLPKQY